MSGWGVPSGYACLARDHVGRGGIAPEDALALDFLKKNKASGGDSAEASSDAANEGVQANSAKAKRFFDHAQTIHETGNYEYAMTMWLQGLRQDPDSVDALEKFLLSAGRFAGGPKKPKGPTSDQKKLFNGRGGLERYLRTLLEWGIKQLELNHGLKAMEAAVKIEANEAAYEIGTRTLGIAASNARTKKDTFVTLLKLFQKIGGYDKAVIAGEQAVRRDPNDAKLHTEVKNMSAQATMSKGGYDQTGQSGGFRANVRDTSTQQELDEEDRIVKSEDVHERVIRRALDDYKERPTDNAAIQKAAKALKDRAKSDDLKLAYKILMKGYQVNQNYRFKMLAGDIKLLVEGRKVERYRRAAEAAPGDEAKGAALVQAREALLKVEIEEFTERVTNMPTDLKMRFALAKRCLQTKQYEMAIENFQQATESPQIAQQARHGLAQSFAAVGWLDEAESTYREAISEHHSNSDEIGTELRYGLMTVLETKARDNNDLDAAGEAFKLASGIAIKKIGFRDIRERRNKIQELVKELKGS